MAQRFTSGVVKGIITLLQSNNGGLKPRQLIPFLGRVRIRPVELNASRGKDVRVSSGGSRVNRIAC